MTRCRPVITCWKAWGLRVLISIALSTTFVCALPPFPQSTGTLRYRPDDTASAHVLPPSAHDSRVASAGRSSVRKVRYIPGAGSQFHAASPAASVNAFRCEHPGLFPDLTGAVPVNMLMIDDLIILRYQKTWHGLPLFGAYETFHVDHENRVRFCLRGIHRGAAINTSASVDKLSAEKLALSHLPAGPQWRSINSQLGIIPPSQGRRAFLAWRVDAVSEMPFAARSVYVDAQRNEVITQRDRLLDLNQGKAYLENPATGPLSIVSLDPIGDTGTLRGPFAFVMDWIRTPDFDDPVGGLNAKADLNGDFFFSPGSERTAEVNVYYHINRIHTLFRGLGFYDLDRPFPAIVNVELCDLSGWGLPLECDNAYYHPLYEHNGYLGGIFFGRTQQGNYGLDGDVIAHEYTHAVVAGTSDLGNVPFWEDAFEASSLNEAYADYFACTLNDNPGLGEYTAQAAGWSEDDAALRDLDNDNVFPDDIAWDPHTTGLIWSGACWELRSHLVSIDPAQGRTRADRLIFASLASLTPYADFADAGTALVAAAQTLEDLSTADVARRILFRRGLLATGIDHYRSAAGGQSFTGIADAMSEAALAVPQYTIDPGEETGALHIHLDADQHVDLYARYGRPVAVDRDGGIIADHSTTLPAETKDLEISRRTSPGIQTGRYYVAVANRSETTAHYTISFTVEKAPPEPNTFALKSGEGITGQIPGGPLLNSTQYIIEIPDAAGRQMTATLEGTGELDLYLRRGLPVARSSEGHILADAVSTLPGSSERILLDHRRLPGFGEGTYYLALVNQGKQTAPFNLVVTVTPATPVNETTETLTPGSEISDTVEPGSGVLGLCQYRITVPTGAVALDIQLSGFDQSDVDLYVRFGTRVGIEDTILADYTSATRGVCQESLTIDGVSMPPLRSGTYFLGVVNNASTAADFTISAQTRTNTAEVILRDLPPGAPLNGQATRAVEAGIGVLNNEIFLIQVPGDAAGLTLTLEAFPSSKDLDLALRRGAAPEVLDGRWIAGYTAGSSDGLEEIYIPGAELAAGTYYAAIANFEPEDVTFQISAALGDGSIELIPGIPQTATIGAPEPGFTVIDTTQYRLEVGSTPVSLFVELRAPTRPDADIDLYLRYDQPVKPAGNTLLTDYRSESNLPTESLFIVSDDVQPGTYYIAVGNISPMPVEYELRASLIPEHQEIVQPLFDGRDFLGYAGPADPGSTAHYPIQFTFDVPPDLESVTFTLECLGNVDLYVRYGQPVQFEGNNITADFSGTIPDDSTEIITIDRFTSPPLSPGTYYLAVVTRELSPVLFLLTPRTDFFTNIPLTSAEARVGSIGGSAGPGYATVSMSQFTIEVPPGTSNLTVELNAGGGEDIDLFARYGANIFLEGVSLQYDYAAASTTGSEILTIQSPDLQGGTYFLAVINNSVSFENYTIEATLSGIPDDRDAPEIDCPEDIVKVGTGLFGELVEFQLAASDTVDPEPHIRAEPPSGSRFPYGTTEVAVTARDFFGNENTCSFTVTILDQTPPELSCPEDIIIKSDDSGTGAPVEFTIAVVDNGDPDPTVTATPPSGSTFPPGTTEVVIQAEDRWGQSSECRFTITVLSTGSQFRRGDANVDNAVNIADAVFNLRYIFADGASPSCLDAADANDDGSVNIADVITILHYLFVSADNLPEPFEECGVDETPDTINCESYLFCATSD